MRLQKDELIESVIDNCIRKHTTITDVIEKMYIASAGPGYYI